jgi:hypothetical protein
MPQLVERRENIKAVFPLAENLVINEGGRLVCNGKSLPLESMSAYRCSNDFLSIIESGHIDIFDKDLVLRRTVRDKRINYEAAGIETFTADDFGLFINSEMLAFQEGKIVNVTKDFNGKLLSPSVRLNYLSARFSDITAFRCSSLADDKTYFEFRCKSDQTIVSNYVVHNNSLLFPVVTQNTKIAIVKLDLLSGKIVWKEPVERSSFNVNSTKSKLYSLALTSETNGKVRYQIIDVEAPSVEVGDSDDYSSNNKIYTPHWLPYLYGDHLYFADNRYPFRGGRPDDPVRFGRMNIHTKRIDLAEMITASPESQIMEIVEHQGCVYVRNADDELFCYQL